MHAVLGLERAIYIYSLLSRPYHLLLFIYPCTIYSSARKEE